MQVIEPLKNKSNSESYDSFLESMNMTESDIQNFMHSVKDNIHTPDGFDHITVCKSSIAGRGLFSDNETNAGDIVCPMRTGTDRTIAGRYTNHAENPNSRPEFVEGILSLVAINKIRPKEEITVNYFDVINCKLLYGERV